MSGAGAHLARSLGLVAVGALLAGAGTIVNGDAAITFIGGPAFSLPTGDGTLITDSGSVDQLYKYCWYYRTPANNQNSVMSKVDVPTEVYSGDTGYFEWNDAGPGATGGEHFDAQLTVHIEDRGIPGHTVATHRMWVRNASTTTKTFQFFNLIDLDLSGTPLDDTSEGIDFSTASGARVAVSEPSGRTAECFGLAATRWEVGSGSSLRAKLSSGSQNLSNASEPFTGDGAIAFQWTLTLAPGETRLLYGGFAIDESVPCPADFDSNGFVNGVDVDDFLVYFMLGDPHADFDHNGFTNGDDFDLYIERFEAGC